MLKTYQCTSLEEPEDLESTGSPTTWSSFDRTLRPDGGITHGDYSCSIFIGRTDSQHRALWQEEFGCVNNSWVINQGQGRIWFQRSQACYWHCALLFGPGSCPISSGYTSQSTTACCRTRWIEIIYSAYRLLCSCFIFVSPTHMWIVKR